MYAVGILISVCTSTIQRIPRNIYNMISDDVYDYYDQKGLFDEQAGEEVELDEEDIIAFACKSARKDGVKIEDEDMPFLVRGELDYEESLGVF